MNAGLARAPLTFVASGLRATGVGKEGERS